MITITITITRTRIILYILALLCLCTNLTAREAWEYDVRGERTQNYWSYKARVSIELPKSIYALGEDIPLHIKIRNHGDRVLRFYVSTSPEEELSSFEPFLVNVRGKKIQAHPKTPGSYRAPSRAFQAKRQVIHNLALESKELILAPEESFEKTIYLNDYYHLRDGINYRGWAYFYPNKAQKRAFFVRSQNSFAFRIDSRKKKAILESDASEKASRLSLSPQETVLLFLSAEMEEDWGNYFKFLELEKYILAYPYYAVLYAQSTVASRTAVLQKFRSFLKNPIGVLQDYRIMRENYLGSTPPEQRYPKRLPENSSYLGPRRHRPKFATVTLEATRAVNNSPIHYRYSYTLQAMKETNSREPFLWKITFVNVEVIKP